jgi:hypothetical protein
MKNIPLSTIREWLADSRTHPIVIKMCHVELARRAELKAEFADPFRGNAPTEDDIFS